MSFGKPFKIATQNVKTAAQQAVKNNMKFACYLANIDASSNGDTVFPEPKDVDDWMLQLFSKNLKPKNIPEKALAAMKSRGVEPKKDPSETILIAVVVGSNTHVHVGVSIPKSFDINLDEFVKSFMNDKKYETVVGDTYLILKNDTEYPFKEKDNVQRNIFDKLKKCGLYSADLESDDEVELNLNDL